MRGALAMAIVTCLLSAHEGAARACTCIDQGGFVKVALDAREVVVGRVVAQTSQDIIIDIPPRGAQRSHTRTRLVGDTGFLCREYASKFPTGSTWMFVLAHRAADAYELSACGQYAVRVEGNLALGVDLRTDQRAGGVERRDLPIDDVYGEVDRARKLRSYSEIAAWRLLAAYEGDRGPTTIANRFESATVTLKVDATGAIRGFAIGQTRDMSRADLERAIRSAALPVPAPELRDELANEGVVAQVERLRGLQRRPVWTGDQGPR